MGRERTFAGFLAGAALLLTALAPCLCPHAAAAANAVAAPAPPACHEAMAQPPEAAAPSPPVGARAIASGCCCTRGSKPPESAPALRNAAPGPEPLLLATAPPPDDAPWLRSTRGEAEPAFEPPRTSQPPPAQNLPLRI